MTTLEDLRKANLKEQRGGGTPVVAKPEPTPEKAVAAKAAEVVETPLITDLTEHGLTIVQAEEPAPAPVTPKPAPVAKAVAPIVTEPVAPEPIAEAVAPQIAAPVVVDPLADRIRTAVLRKRLIPAGVKATVDMSPELFWRAKKYCHDHSNSTLRQLMLETLTQFLDEEGY